MKSFAPSFNISVLNLGLKSGIWAGITAVSFASGAVTIVNNWSFLRTQITNFYQQTIKTYILDPLSSSHVIQKYLVGGSTEIYGKLKEWYKLVGPDKFLENIRQYISLQKLINGYSSLMVKTSEYFLEIFKLLKKFFNPSAFKVETIRWLISSFVNIINLLRKIDSSNFNLIMKLLGDEHIREIVAELVGVAIKYPEILGYIEKKDIEKALKNSIGEKFETFMEKAKKLRENPIKDKKGKELKDEIMKRLFPEHDCEAENLVSGLFCVGQKAVKDILQETTRCKDKKTCDDSKIYMETTQSIYENLRKEISDVFQLGDLADALFGSNGKQTVASSGSSGPQGISESSGPAPAG